MDSEIAKLYEDIDESVATRVEQVKKTNVVEDQKASRQDKGVEKDKMKPSKEDKADSERTNVDHQDYDDEGDSSQKLEKVFGTGVVDSTVESSRG